jgi:hypothetical protein
MELPLFWALNAHTAHAMDPREERVNVYVSIQAQEGVALITVMFPQDISTSDFDAVSRQILGEIALVEGGPELCAQLFDRAKRVLTELAIGWELIYPYEDPEFPEKLTAAIETLSPTKSTSRTLH